MGDRGEQNESSLPRWRTNVRCHEIADHAVGVFAYPAAVIRRRPVAGGLTLFRTHARFPALRFCGVVVQSVSTLACQARGRGFEPRRPRHFVPLERHCSGGLCVAFPTPHATDLQLPSA